MEPKNALGKQYKKLFSMNNVSIWLVCPSDEFSVSNGFALGLHIVVQPSHNIAGKATFYRESS